MSRVLLCVGGLDPSGGAGILADRRAARAAGCKALSVLSAITAQNSARVFAVRAVPGGLVRSQLVALEQEVSFGAVKTGLFAGRASIQEFASWYRAHRAGPLVVDPVFAAGDGTVFAGGRVRAALVRELFPLAALVTPNRMEAAALTGLAISRSRGMEDAARAISDLGARAVLLKGGHLRGCPEDLLWDGREAYFLRGGARLRGRWHGLGCHLASAIAARLALGEPLLRAVVSARRILRAGMLHPCRTPSGRLVPRWPRAGRTRSE